MEEHSWKDLGRVFFPSQRLSPVPSCPFKGDYIRILSIVFGQCLMGFMGKEPIQKLSFSPDCSPQGPPPLLSEHEQLRVVHQLCWRHTSYWSPYVLPHYVLLRLGQCPGLFLPTGACFSLNLGQAGCLTISELQCCQEIYDLVYYLDFYILSLGAIVFPTL